MNEQIKTIYIKMLDKKIEPKLTIQYVSPLGVYHICVNARVRHWNINKHDVKYEWTLTDHRRDHLFRLVPRIWHEELK